MSGDGVMGVDANAGAEIDPEALPRCGAMECSVAEREALRDDRGGLLDDREWDSGDAVDLIAAEEPSVVQRRIIMKNVGEDIAEELPWDGYVRNTLEGF